MSNFSYLVDPDTNKRIDLLSLEGKNLLKSYVKYLQAGGAEGGSKVETGKVETGKVETGKVETGKVETEQNSLRQLMEAINTDNPEMIESLGKSIMGHYSDNRYKVFDYYRAWAMKPRNNDSVEELNETMFLFGKPTSNILRILHKLYEENRRRHNWYDDQDSPTGAFMFGIAEVESPGGESHILVTISGDTDSGRSIGQDYKLYENIYYNLIPMMKNIGITVSEDDDDDGEIKNLYAGYKSDMNATTAANIKIWGPTKLHSKMSVDEEWDYPKQILYVHNNPYMYGIRYVPFKRRTGGNIKCNNGSSCVESKLFSYIHRHNLTVKGLTACWVGGNAHKRLKSTRKCMNSYTFCSGKFGDSTNVRVMDTIILALEDELKEAFPEDTVVDKNKARMILEHIAVPCPGCQMNELRYNKGVPEIKWLNTMCTDIVQYDLGGVGELTSTEQPSLYETLRKVSDRTTSASTKEKTESGESTSETKRTSETKHTKDTKK